MKVLLDIEDSKAPFVIELLKNLTFVKAKLFNEEKEHLIAEIKRQSKTSD